MQIVDIKCEETISLEEVMNILRNNEKGVVVLTDNMDNPFVLHRDYSPGIYKWRCLIYMYGGHDIQVAHTLKDVEAEIKRNLGAVHFFRTYKALGKWLADRKLGA